MAGILLLLPIFVLLLQFDRTSSSHGEKNVTAHEGENAALQCETRGNMTVLSVNVKQPEHNHYVYYQTDTRAFDERDQEPRFRGRVRLEQNVTCTQSKCSFSVVIAEVSAGDAGSYTCWFRDSEGRTLTDSLSLTVTDTAASAKEDQEDHVSSPHAISDITWKALLGICVVVAAAGLVALIVWIFINTKVMARENAVVEKCKTWWRQVRGENNEQHRRTPPGVGGPETDMLNSVNIIDDYVVLYLNSQDTTYDLN